VSINARDELQGTSDGWSPTRRRSASRGHAPPVQSPLLSATTRGPIPRASELQYPARMSDSLAGLTPTGRTVDGPTADLVELTSAEGPLTTAIVLNERYRSLERLQRAITLGEGFMCFPMVTGLVEMTRYDRDAGALCYATGASRSIAEILKSHRDAGKMVGKRAAAELCYLAGMVLTEAAETGASQGVFSHGDLNPWRVLVRADGEVQLIGYGLPSPEVLLHHAGEASETLADTWRYAPPERVAGTAEDVHADLLSLALIATEMITGEPLLNGSDDKIRADLSGGQLSSALAKHARALGKDLAEALAYAVNFDPRNRYDSGEDFVAAMERIVEAAPPGDSLAQAAAKVPSRQRGKTLRAVEEPTAPARGTGRAIRPRGRRAVEAAIEAAAERGDESRWTKPSRQPSETPEPATPRARRRGTDAPPSDLPDADARPRRRTRSSVAEDTAAAEPPASPAARPRRRAAATSDAAPEDRPRPRSRAAAPASTEGAAPATRPRSRTRAAPPPAATSPAADETPSDSPRPRRRTASSASDGASPRPRRRTKKNNE